MDKYYIYAHLDDNGKPVYIGKGCGDRAWCPSRYNADHEAWITEKLPHLNVQIIASKINESEARSLEKILLAEIQPKWNKFKLKPIIANGKRYHCIEQAMKFLNMTESAIRNKVYNKNKDWRFDNEL